MKHSVCPFKFLYTFAHFQNCIKLNIIFIITKFLFLKIDLTPNNGERMHFISCCVPDSTKKTLSDCPHMLKHSFTYSWVTNWDILDNSVCIIITNN